LSSGEGSGQPVRHRLDFGGNRRINSVLYIASVTQHRDIEEARTYINCKISEGKARREARERTNDTSPTESSGACGTTSNTSSTDNFNLPLDKGAYDSPARSAGARRLGCSSSRIAPD
jgi:hypothetical protein